MSNENRCPQCSKVLVWDAGSYQCFACNAHYKKVAFCPGCGAELEKLQACGAVSYFCNTCNELKSKSTVRIAFRAQS